MPSQPPGIDILGVPIAPLDLERTVAHLEGALASGERVFVITANPEFVMLARRDPGLFEAHAPARRLIVPDGIGLVLAARLLGIAIPGRARGRDLVVRLAELARRRRLSLYLLGAGPGVAARAGAALARRVEGLHVAGTYAGSAEPDADDDTVARVAAAHPDILLVAFGMPKQERWIARNLPLLPTVRVAVGVGGAFDYLAGLAPLPPEWLARVGLEWLWRLVRQPWRWRRQLVLPVFLLLVLRERLRAA
jgi:N-acetylglucosaminyldiphosphoundecaprenol N-acetyl-beta-D-mannosaminyltransferase